MTETEFIKFYKEKNGVKNKEEAKEKIDNFWNALLKAIAEDKKDVKSRKIVIPIQRKEAYTKPKKVLKFRAGEGLIKLVNERGENSE